MYSIEYEFQWILMLHILKKSIAGFDIVTWKYAVTVLSK